MTYEYDAENNRVSVTENSGGTLSETEYVVNPHAALSQVLIKTVGHEQTYYVYGLGLIGQEVAGEYSTYHFDLRGSTVAITDVSGKVTDRYQYSAYGELLSSTGDTNIPFLFNGRDGVVTDTNGLYYMRARYYNPEIRRFVSQDTLLGVVIDGQSLNRYAYVQGNPVGFVDPLGLARDGWGKQNTNIMATNYTNHSRPLNDEWLQGKDEKQLKEMYKKEKDPTRKAKIKTQQKYPKYRDKDKRNNQTNPNAKKGSKKANITNIGEAGAVTIVIFVGFKIIKVAGGFVVGGPGGAVAGAAI